MSDNIHIKYCDSGIIKVIINTVHKWVEYSVYTNHTGQTVVEEMDEHGFLNGIYPFTIDFKPDTRYTRITDQEKDQIYVYFIPTDMI